VLGYLFFCMYLLVYFVMFTLKIRDDGCGLEPTRSKNDQSTTPQTNSVFNPLFSNSLSWFRVRLMMDKIRVAMLQNFFVASNICMKATLDLLLDLLTFICHIKCSDRIACIIGGFTVVFY